MAKLWELVQTGFFVLALPFFGVAFVAMAIGSTSQRLGNSIMRGPYYWACQRKRRLLGEPAWKPIDWKLGVPPPPGVDIPSPGIMPVPSDEELLAQYKEGIAAVEQRLALRQESNR